jgi:hypothetical protein
LRGPGCAVCEARHNSLPRCDLRSPPVLDSPTVPDAPRMDRALSFTGPRTHPRLSARLGKRSRLALVSCAAAATVVAGVSAASVPDATQDATVSPGSETASVDSDEFIKSRTQRASRSATRIAPRVVLEPEATDHKFATALLNIWKEPREEGERLGLIQWGTKVAVTGQRVGHWAEVLLPGRERQLVRWVNADYLADTKPKPEPTSGSSDSSRTSEGQPREAAGVGGSCNNGTSVPSGVSSNIAAIHQAVCSSWPQISTYGTLRADSGDHGSGRAVDIMVSGSSAWEVAEFLRANYGSFGINYVIHARNIWSVDRAGEGWRGMEDRGSTTANHYDHVHVSVY